MLQEGGLEPLLFWFTSPFALLGFKVGSFTEAGNGFLFVYVISYPRRNQNYCKLALNTLS
jgi:hypothetical protein